MKTMIYVLTEWNGKGSGENICSSNDKKEVMKTKLHVLTYNQAVRKYGKNYFRCDDVPCSTIDSYESLRKLSNGIVKTTKNWY